MGLEVTVAIGGSECSGPGDRFAGTTLLTIQGIEESTKNNKDARAGAPMDSAANP